MNCAQLVADLFLFCYERDFIVSLSEEYQFEVIEAFNSTSRYFDDLLNIDNNFFGRLISQTYPSELHLNRTNSSETEAPFLNMSILDGFISYKIYDKRDDFDFEIVKFPYLDGDVPRRAYFGVYKSHIIRFARASSNFTDFITRNKLLTTKLLNQGYRYHNSTKLFLNFIDVISI